MRPAQISRPIETDDLYEVTSQMEIISYIHDNEGKKRIVVRLKKDNEFDIGIDVSDELSDKIIKYLKQ